MNRMLYELIHSLRFVPNSWIFGEQPELAQLVESGRLPNGRAIDLGCGLGVQSVYLAKGFDVTGVDFATTAITRARKR